MIHRCREVRGVHGFHLSKRYPAPNFGCRIESAADRHMSKLRGKNREKAA